MQKKFVVTGGGGFLGKAIALKLRSLGHEVVAIARGDYPGLRTHGVKTVQADLGLGGEALLESVTGAEAVFHVAAKVDMWGRYQDYVHSNVLGTRNVIAACRAAGVRKLIFTSSPSVVADGKDLKGINEDYPYPLTYSAYYPKTKAIAERELLAANDGQLATIALRPHLIWGPGDTNLVPIILARARANRLVRVGAGKNVVDFTFIDDCVQAHLDALRALDENPAVRGRAYFITQGDPVPLWEWINELLKLHGFPAVTRAISKKIAMPIAFLCESVARLLPWGPEPFLTRFLVSEMSTDHYFDISRARRDLGYSPSISIRAALQKAYGRA